MQMFLLRNIHNTDVLISQPGLTKESIYITVAYVQWGGGGRARSFVLSGNAESALLGRIVY